MVHSAETGSPGAFLPQLICSQAWHDPVSLSSGSEHPPNTGDRDWGNTLRKVMFNFISSILPGGFAKTGAQGPSLKALIL